MGHISHKKGLLWWLRQQRICLQYRRPGFDPRVGKITWRGEWLPIPVFLPGEFHGQRSLAGCYPWGSQKGGNSWMTNTHTDTHKKLLKCFQIACIIWHYTSNVWGSHQFHIISILLGLFFFFLILAILMDISLSFLFVLFWFLMMMYVGCSSSDSKASAYNVGDPGSIPGSGRSPGEGNGNPLQYSCLENPMDWGFW